MSTNASDARERPEALPDWRRLLLAVDSSDHANAGIRDGVRIAAQFGARISAAHVYAAKMHDVRFRQMEGGLPAQFREEVELERQRDVHDDLITRGLSIITDSYLDQVERETSRHGLTLVRRSLEGKNYRKLADEANSGAYDLLVIGALGLGAVAGARLGTVCERVVRRTQVDTLVIRETDRSIAEGPIAVAVDGSTRAWGGLLSAFALARAWSVPVHVLSAFDPYYHYVAFNRIAGVLSEEAGKVFRFQEQEKLHEEIIDSGLAKIYDGHLAIARSLADEHGIEITTQLLDGKPHDVLARRLRELRPSLLVLGKLGIHADPGLDIGGNAERLLRDVECAVLLSQREFRPPVEQIAEVTTSWTDEAEARMRRVPESVRNMARMAILRFAQERGHTVVTAGIVGEATAQLMPRHAEEAMAEIVAAHDARSAQPGGAAPAPAWTPAASAVLSNIDDPSVRDNVRLRAEKKARGERATEVTPAHLGAVAATPTPDRGAPALNWAAAALARLARVPEGFMRAAARERIESLARDAGAAQVTLALAEAGLAVARTAMGEARASGSGDTATASGGCPFAAAALQQAESTTAPGWTVEAETRLEAVPEGFCRTLTRRAADTLALQSGRNEVDAPFVEQVLGVFTRGSTGAALTMPWSEEARSRIERAPETVRGMLVREVEGWARRNGHARVDAGALNAVKGEWQTHGVFHLDPADPRNGH